MFKIVVSIMLALCPITALATNLDCPERLKDGAETRCLPGMDMDEFSEENYAGAYTLGPDKCVFIEDARKRKGHLVLHVDCLGLHCPLYRFNKYIYVYGAPPGDAAPIRGTVTFMSDGYQINQLILQHEASQAYFPFRQ